MENIKKLTKWLEKQAGPTGPKIVQYKEAGKVIDKEASDPYLWWLLGEISKKSYANHKILLSMIVVNGSMKPGGLKKSSGLRKLIEDLGINIGNDLDAFVFNEMRKVWAHYSK